MDIIKTAKLNKHYGKSRGIIDVDLTVEKGDFFGFIGPNGAGKSTTIRTLLGLISPSSGSARIFDKDIVKDKEEILMNVGYLPSEAIFYQGMKVKELLKLSADLHKKDCTKESQRLCALLQLDENRKIDELSFGNRKKVGIVAALQHEPELLILDEPTSGLDPLMQKVFFDILKEKNQQGVTIFISSHILSEIEHYCNKAAIIKEGRIIALDSVETLCKKSAKHLVVNGEIDLSKLNGIKGFKADNGISTFLYNGEIEELLKVLAKGKINDLTISEPDLEEVFMHYYEKDGEE